MRLEGTRPRATVVDKVVRSGKTAGHGNGRSSVPDRTQTKRAGPKVEAGPSASTIRKAGKASPARDERLANLEQRDPRSGDVTTCFVYHPFIYRCFRLSQDDASGKARMLPHRLANTAS